MQQLEMIQIETLDKSCHNLSYLQVSAACVYWVLENGFQ